MSYSASISKISFNKVELQKSKHKIIVKQKARAISQYLCKVFPKVEWSGFAIYKVTSGNIKEDNLVMELVDILLMDIGDAVYTEFDTGETLSNFLFDNDYIDGNYYISLIHSHNQMQTFYSSTDQSTLAKYAESYVHFVSTITNNKEEIISAITCKLSKEIKSEITTSIPSFEGSEYQISKEFTSSKDTKDYAYYYLQVEKEEITENYNFKELELRIEEIKEEKKKREEEEKKKWNIYDKKNYRGLEITDDLSEYYSYYSNYSHINTPLNSKGNSNPKPNITISKTPANMNEHELFLFRILSLNIGFTPTSFFSPATYTKNLLTNWIKEHLDNNYSDYALILSSIIKIALSFVTNEYVTINYAIDSIELIQKKYPELSRLCNIIIQALKEVLYEDSALDTFSSDLPWIEDISELSEEELDDYLGYPNYDF